MVVRRWSSQVGGNQLNGDVKVFEHAVHTPQYPSKDMIRYVSHIFRMTLWRPLTSASTWRKNFLKAKVLAVCATAVQSRILGPTKLLRFETSSHYPMIHVLLIEHLSKQNCRTHRLKIRRKGHLVTFMRNIRAVDINLQLSGLGARATYPLSLWLCMVILGIFNEAWSRSVPWLQPFYPGSQQSITKSNYKNTHIGIAGWFTQYTYTYIIYTILYKYI